MSKEELEYILENKVRLKNIIYEDVVDIAGTDYSKLILTIKNLATEEKNSVIEKDTFVLEYNERELRGDIYVDYMRLPKKFKDFVNEEWNNIEFDKWLNDLPIYWIEIIKLLNE